MKMSCVVERSETGSAVARGRLSSCLQPAECFRWRLWRVLAVAGLQIACH